MDAVITGLGAGVVTAILVLVPGVIAWKSDVGEGYSKSALFAWLILLTAGLLGQTVLSYFLIIAFAAAPSQTDKGVVL